MFAQMKILSFVMFSLIPVLISSVDSDSSKTYFMTSYDSMLELLANEQRLVDALEQYAKELQLKLDTAKESVNCVNCRFKSFFTKVFIISEALPECSLN